MKRWTWVFMVLFVLFLAGGGYHEAYAKSHYSGNFWIREYDLREVDIRVHYFKYGATRYQVRTSTNAIDLSVGGYKQWHGSALYPIDYLEINKRVIYGGNVRHMYAFLHREGRGGNKTFLEVEFNFSKIPRNREKDGINIDWILASGPTFSRVTPQSKIDKMISRSKIRPWDWASRNAIMISEDGLKFALITGWGSVWDCARMLTIHKEYFYLMMFDGGSSSAPSALNPVWVTVHSKPKKKK